ncbi:MAG: hypothetical protein KOO60_13915 [Gemmatimonadales bacterium]|nr:hypothetical protein [Gemmatimonadales bacterium]
MFKALTANLMIAFLVLLQSTALAGLAPLDESYGEIAYSGPGIPVLCNVPDGSGNPFTSAQVEPGISVDATMKVYLRDGMNDPIINYPAEDIWLESLDNGLIACQGGSTADGPSDQNGVATWVSPLRAGGSSQALTQVVINGMPLTTSPGLALHHVSPDIDGNLVVNLMDVIFFAQDYANGYAFQSDFYVDMTVNIVDLSKLAMAIGADCP